MSKGGSDVTESVIALDLSGRSSPGSFATSRPSSPATWLEQTNTYTSLLPLLHSISQCLPVAFLQKLRYRPRTTAHKATRPSKQVDSRSMAMRTAFVLALCLSTVALTACRDHHLGESKGGPSLHPRHSVAVLAELPEGEPVLLIA